MGIFDKHAAAVKDAEGFGRTPFLEDPGNYLVRVVKHTIGTSKANEGKIKVVCDYELVETASPKKHPRGDRRSWVVLLDPGAKQTFATKLGSVKLHFAEVAGILQDGVDSSFLTSVENNPTKFEGTLMRVVVSSPVTTKSGNPFTPVSWYAYDEDAADVDAEEGTDDEQSSGGAFADEDIPF